MASFTVIVNNQPLQIYFNYNPQDILSVYALQRDGAFLPSHLRYDTKPEIRENENLIIRNIQEEVEWEELINQITRIKNETRTIELLENLSEKYSNLSAYEIIKLLLWSNTVLPGDLDEKLMRQELNYHYDFMVDLINKGVIGIPTDKNDFIRDILFYKEEISAKRRGLKNYLESIIPKFDKNLIPEEITEFEPEKEVKQYKFSLNRKQPNEYIFNKLILSMYVPYCHYITKDYYKVDINYKNIINESWMNYKIEKDDIFVIYILSTSLERLEKYKGEKIDLFSKVVWNKNNYIEITLNTRFSDNITVNDIIERFTMCLTNIPYQLEETYIPGNIKGTFRVLNNKDFNKAVFSDLITNDPIISKMFFLSENGIITERGEASRYNPSKPANNRKDYTIYYRSQSNNYFIEDSISVIITPHYKTVASGQVEKWLEVRLRGGADVKEINNFMFLFPYIYAYYLSRKNIVIREYTQFLPNAEELFTEYEVKMETVKKDSRTGKRMLELKNKRPNIYTSMQLGNKCGYQTRIVEDENEVRNIRENRGDEYLMRYPKSLEYMDDIEQISTSNLNTNLDEDVYDWYTCFDKNKLNRSGKSSDYVYPYLVSIKSDDPEAPLKYIPCCGKKDKKRKLPTRYKSGTTILQYIKYIPDGRKGYLPPSIELFFNISSPEEKYFRLGVPLSPSSLLHTIAYGLKLKINNISYNLLQTPLTKIEAINKLRLELVNKDSSFYNLCLAHTKENVNELKNIMGDMNQYLDPLIFTPMLEEYFNCNIFLFVYSEDYKNGSVITPYYSDVYTYKEKSKKNTLCIMLREMKNYYQCEIITSNKNSLIGTSLKLKLDECLKEMYDVKCISKIRSTLNLGLEMMNDTEENFIDEITPEIYNYPIPNN